MITACTSLQPPRTAPHCRTALAAFALVTRAVPPQSPVVSPRARPPATCAAPCRAIPARRSLLALGVLGIVSFPPLRGGAGAFTRAPLVGKPGLAMFARALTAGGGEKPLMELLQTSKEACDAIGAMVRPQVSSSWVPRTPRLKWRNCRFMYSLSIPARRGACIALLPSAFTP